MEVIRKRGNEERRKELMGKIEERKRGKREGKEK